MLGYLHYRRIRIVGFPSVIGWLRNIFLPPIHYLGETNQRLCICTYLLTFANHIHSFFHSYYLLSAGSTYSGGVVRFDVRKGDLNTPMGGGADAKDSLSRPADVIAVTVPRELRGRSEILVFLSDKPIQGMQVESMSLYVCVYVFCFCGMRWI